MYLNEDRPGIFGDHPLADKFDKARLKDMGNKSQMKREMARILIAHQNGKEDVAEVQRELALI